MTIAHFVVGDSFGGVEGHICTLIKLMQYNSDFHFQVICHESVEAKFRDRLKNYNADIIALPLWPKPTFRGYFLLINTLKKLSPDVLQCHLYSATRFGAMAAKIAGIENVVETIHIEEVWRKGLKKFLFCSVDGLIGRLFVDNYIAVSKAVSRFYQQNKWVPDHKISLVHNTTELEGGKINPDKKFSYKIGFLGRLVDQKGVDILIKSMEILSKKNQQWHLYIGGTGPLESELGELVNDLKLQDSVTFLGNVSDKDKFFGMIDIFVLPSRFEGFPLVLLEAGMYRMPVVATDVSGNPEIISHNKTGLLVENEVPQQLASAIDEFENEEKRRKLAENLANLVQSEFSKNRYVEKMEAFYYSLKHRTP